MSATTTLTVPRICEPYDDDDDDGGDDDEEEEDDFWR